MDCLLPVRGAKDMTPPLIRRDFAFLCRKTTAALQQIDCNAYSKITANCQQIVSNFYLGAPHFLDCRIGTHAENIGSMRSPGGSGGGSSEFG